MIAWQQHRTLGSALLVGITTLALALGLVGPTYQKVALNRAKLVQKTTELEETSNRVALLSQLDPNVLSERVMVLDSALPPRKDVLMYLAAINGLSNELGLSFGGINLAPGVLTEATESGKKQVKAKTLGLEVLESEVKIRGSLESIYAFLRTIEEVKPLMQIDDLKVAVSADGQYSLSLSLGMLWAQASTAEVKGQVTLFGEEEEKYFQQLSSYRSYPPIVLQGNEIGGKSDVFAPLILQP